MEETKKMWMVRLGGHICGPYETKVVESLIESQKISEIDEVALPCRGWSYVRDRGEFLEVLEKLRSGLPSSGLSRDSLSSITKTVGATATDFEKTEELTSSDSNQKDDADDSTSPLIEFNSEDFSTSPDNKMYKNKKLKSVSNKAIRYIAFSLCALGFVLVMSPDFLKFVNVSVKKIWSVSSAKNFEIYWKSGDYKNALISIKRNKKLEDAHREKLVSALLVESENLKQAEAEYKLLKRKNSAVGKNLGGLLNWYKGEEQQAESQFLSALETRSSYTPSLVNLGLLQRKKGSWGMARVYFESALAKAKTSSSTEAINFYLLESWMRQALAEEGRSSLEKVYAHLQNQTVRPTTFIYEFKLLEIWISASRGTWPVSEGDLSEDLLSLDPYILFERKLSPYTYRLPKRTYSYICNDLKFKLRAARYKNLVVAICSVVNQDYEAAGDLLKNTQVSEHVLALRSFIYKIQNKDDQADESLSKAMGYKENKSLLKFFLQARFCYDKGDYKCAAEYWMKGLKRKPDAYTAHTGLARAYYQVEDYERAAVFLKRANGFTTSYGPLIELQMLMNKVKD